MSIISDQAKRMMPDGISETESDIDERVIGEDDDDVSEQPLFNPSPRVSETFDSPPVLEGATESIIEFLPLQTAIPVNVCTSLNERSPALVGMLFVFLDSIGIKNSRGR
jgi:hypothetical protein